MRPGYALPLAIQKFDDAAVLQTLIVSAQFTSVVSEDGQMITQARLDVKNNGRQFMELDLPNHKDEMWSAFVSGRAVRPTKNKNTYLLPLDQSENGAPFQLEFTYASRFEFPKSQGDVELQTPQFNVPMQDAQWQLYLPDDYRYDDFKGSMTRTGNSGNNTNATPVTSKTLPSSHPRPAITPATKTPPMPYRKKPRSRKNNNSSITTSLTPRQISKPAT